MNFNILHIHFFAFKIEFRKSDFFFPKSVECSIVIKKENSAQKELTFCKLHNIDPGNFMNDLNLDATDSDNLDDLVMMFEN